MFESIISYVAMLHHIKESLYIYTVPLLALVKELEAFRTRPSQSPGEPVFSVMVAGWFCPKSG
jgi:hypothetical protein